MGTGGRVSGCDVHVLSGTRAHVRVPIQAGPQTVMNPVLMFFKDCDASGQRRVTLLMLGSGAPPGGWLKVAGSSSSSSVDDAGVGCRVGLDGLQDVAADSGAGWSFTSGLLDAGSRAAGDRARLACRGGGEGGGGKGRL